MESTITSNINAIKRKESDNYQIFYYYFFFLTNSRQITNEFDFTPIFNSNRIRAEFVTNCLCQLGTHKLAFFIKLK